MYKVLIVDDEIAARETIAALIDWEKIGFSQVVLAKNGKHALEYFEKDKFDIIITDIQMPIMSGIELIEEIKRISPEQKFIIISCHESFDYARKAIQLGVTDYIIKDLATKVELEALILSMLSDIKRQYTFENGVNADISEKLREFIAKGSKQDLVEISEAIGFSKTHSLVGFSLFLSRKGGNLEWSGCVLKFRDLIKKKFPASFMAYDNEVFILSSAESNFSMLYFMNNVLEQANFIRLMASKCGIKSVSIGISEYSKNLERIPDLYRHAKEASEMRMFVGLNKNIFYDTISTKATIYDSNNIDERLYSIKKMLYNANKNISAELCDVYKDRFDVGFAKINYYRYVNDILFGFLQGFVDAKHINRKKIEECGIKLSSSYINSLETIEEMRDYFVNVFSRLLKDNSHENLSISDRAKNLIYENLERKISLNEIAEMMHLHKSYLSRIFKEETGENIVQYIVNTKLERAKSLLKNTNMKPSDISNILGFATPQYFSIVFKKYTDETPSQYRKEK